MSCQSHLSANEKADNEVKLEVSHRFLGIYLTVEENSGKRQLGNQQIKAVRPVIDSNGVPYIQTRSVGSHNTSGKEKKENMGRFTLFQAHIFITRVLTIVIFVFFIMLW